jgi:hypothetical protein
VVILFVKKLGVAVHAPGRAISSMVAKLKTSVPAPTYNQLCEFHSLVIELLTNKNPSIEQELQEKLPALKDIVLGKGE